VLLRQFRVRPDFKVALTSGDGGNEVRAVLSGDRERSTALGQKRTLANLTIPDFEIATDLPTQLLKSLLEDCKPN
jgi:hypothetical protein